MKDKMQHNSGNYSSDQMAKQKLKIFCSSSKNSTDNENLVKLHEKVA